MKAVKVFASVGIAQTVSTATSVVINNLDNYETTHYVFSSYTIINYAQPFSLGHGITETKRRCSQKTQY